MRHHTTRKITFLKFYSFTNIFCFWKLIQAMKNMDPENGKHKWKPKKTWSFGTLNKWYLVINTIHYNTMHGIHIVYVPGITKNSVVNIQQPSILLKVFFSGIVFVIFLKIFRTSIKDIYVRVLLLKKSTI